MAARLSTKYWIIAYLLILLPYASACTIFGYVLENADKAADYSVSGYCVASDRTVSFKTGADGTYGMLFGSPFEPCDKLCGRIELEAVKGSRSGKLVVNATEFPGKTMLRVFNITIGIMSLEGAKTTSGGGGGGGNTLATEEPKDTSSWPLKSEQKKVIETQKNIEEQGVEIEKEEAVIETEKEKKTFLPWLISAIAFLIIFAIIIFKKFVKSSKRIKYKK